MRDGCFVVYRERAISHSFEAEMLAWVESMDDYRGGVGDGEASHSRVQKWYQERGHYFDSSWKRRFARWEAHPYSECLAAFQRRVQVVVDRLCREHLPPQPPPPRFNSLLLNKYRDGRDCIRPHSDSCHAFGVEPLIAVVSLGETRTFQYTSKTDPDDSATVELASGSILLMAGQMQQHYTHEIVRDPRAARERYSLTWRHFLERTPLLV